MNNPLSGHASAAASILFASLLCRPVLAENSLFQNLFFTLSQSNQLLCTTRENGFKSIPELLEIIQFYELNNPHHRQQAIAVLTDHKNQSHLEDLAAFRQACKISRTPELCILQLYWDDDQEATLRALALFYDTRTIIKHSEWYDLPRFNRDHLRLFEKGIRKIPAYLRTTISHAKPLSDFVAEVTNLPEKIQPFAREAQPIDYETSLWTDNTYPLKFIPGNGYGHEIVAQVFSGQNLIQFNVKAFDKGGDGNMYRDINLKYLVDFRLPILMHELAHTIDNFHFWNGQDDLYFFYWYRKISTDAATSAIIKKARLALWPSKWFEAYEYLWEVNEGRYNGRLQEKLAELIAQYILLPEQLKHSSPVAYQWLRQDVFLGIEYQGYASCMNPLVEPLDFWQDAIAKILGR